MKKTLAMLISCTMILSSSCVLQAKSPKGNPGPNSYKINHNSKINKTKSLDINHDGKINIKDMKALDEAFNTTYKDKKFNPAADLNNDKVVNMADRMLLMKYFKEHNIPVPTMPDIKTPVPTPIPTQAPAVNYDINRDGSIDAKDMEVIDNSFNTLQGNPNFNPAADLNGDGAINMPDRMLLMAYFSQNNIPIPTVPPISDTTPIPTLTQAPAVNYDINRDGIIDAMDMAVIDNSFNTLQGNPNFNPAADLNGDGAINMPDRMLLMAYFSQNNIPIPTMPPISDQTPAPTSTPTPKPIKNCDINRDGYINMEDLILIDKAFNTRTTEAGSNPDCDLNGDTAVNMADKMFFIKSLTEQIMALTVPATTNVPTSAPQSQSTISMNFDTTQINAVGQVICATLQVNNISELDGYQAYIQYDPEVLQPVTSADRAYTGATQPENGTLFQNSNYAPVGIAINDITNGRLYIVKSYSDQKNYRNNGPEENTGSLGVIRFKVLKLQDTNIIFRNTNNSLNEKSGIVMFDWNGNVNSNFEVVQPAPLVVNSVTNP